MDNKTNSYGLGNYDTENIINNEQEQIDNNMKNYMDERSNAEQVAYDTMREDAYKTRVDSGLASLSTNREILPAPEYNPEYTHERVDSLLNSVKTREEKEEDVPERVNIPVQPTKASSKIIDEEHIKRLQNRKKKFIAALVLAGTITLAAAGINTLTKDKPEIANNDWYKTEQFDSMQDVVDSVNEHKQQQIESGITTHPEHVINSSSHEEQVGQMKEEKNQKEEKMEEIRNKSMSNSMEEFVEHEKREKVIKIESGITAHPEQVVDNIETQGGRSHS